jgi:hypothetical protein
VKDNVNRFNIFVIICDPYAHRGLHNPVRQSHLTATMLYITAGIYCLLFPVTARFAGFNQRGRRLEGWSNTAARLAGWRRAISQGVILYVMDGPCRLPWRTTPLAPVWSWSVTKCTQNTVMELRHARKAWPGTLVDPCVLSGFNRSVYMYGLRIGTRLAGILSDVTTVQGRFRQIWRCMLSKQA